MEKTSSAYFSITLSSIPSYLPLTNTIFSFFANRLASFCLKGLAVAKGKII